MPNSTARSDSNAKCGLIGIVVRNDLICREHAAIIIRAAEFGESAPGQFVQVLCAPAGENPRESSANGGKFSSVADAATASPAAYLRRPFSIADAWIEDGTPHILLISRRVGAGTAWLERLHTGEQVDLTGPLGNGFRLPEPGVPIVLIGGGVGIPPMLYLARVLHDRGHEDVTVIFGATTSDLLPVQLLTGPDTAGNATACVELRGGAAYHTAITTDDGSCGMRGVVTDALRIWHSSRPALPAGAATVFACGPEPMLRAVAVETRSLGLDCQLCIERHMGCGLGTCLSCVVRVRDEHKVDGWRWALTCTDGPVFDRDTLWEPSES